MRTMWVNENRGNIVNKDGSINPDYQGVQSDGKGGLVKTGKFDINSQAVTDGIVKQAIDQAPMKQTIVTGKYPPPKEDNAGEGTIINGLRNPFDIANDGRIAITYKPKNGNDGEFKDVDFEAVDGDATAVNR